MQHDIACATTDPGYMSRKFESFERINSIRLTNGNFYSCNSCKWLGTTRLHELHESNFRFLNVSNLSVRNFRISLMMYPGSLTGGGRGGGAQDGACRLSSVHPPPDMIKLIAPDRPARAACHGPPLPPPPSPSPTAAYWVSGAAPDTTTGPVIPFTCAYNEILARINSINETTKSFDVRV